MIDINKIPEFIGQIPAKLSQIDARDFMGRIVTYSKDNSTLLVGLLVAVLALGILYCAYQRYTKAKPVVSEKQPESQLTEQMKILSREASVHRAKLYSPYLKEGDERTEISQKLESIIAQQKELQEKIDKEKSS